MSSRFGRRGSRPSWAVLLTVAVLFIYQWYQKRNQPVIPDALSEGKYKVERVVDGDTLVLDNQARVRLIGVDTPETVAPGKPVQAFGPEATAFTKQFLAGGWVRLQFDKERKDRYDRYLAYVYVEDQMLNEALLRAGLAKAATDFRFSDAFKRRFREAEAEARQARLGLWSAENN